MHGIAMIGLCLSFFMFFIIKKHPSSLKPNDTPILSGLKIVLSEKRAWLTAFYGFLMYVPLTIIGDTWGVPFLERLYQKEQSVVATIISGFFIGIALGSPCFSLFSDIVKSRKWPMFLASLLSLIVYSFILYSDSIPMPLMYVLFFIVGFFFGGKT